jgi:hypothetical protein
MFARNSSTLTAITLLLCAAAFAQFPEPLPAGMRGGLLARAMRLSQSGLMRTYNAEVGTQPEAPVLSLTWGIVTFPGQTDSGAASVNKTGYMVGGYGPLLQFNYTNSGFLLKGTSFTQIDYPGANWTEPLAISDNNVVIGAYGPTAESPAQGFMLKGKTYTSITYPGAGYTRPSGINKSGDIVGEAIDTADHGFLLSKGVFTSINYPGAASTVAWSINNTGEIAGFYGDSSGNTHGFTLISGVYTTLDYPGYSQNYVADINDSGLIVGGYGNETTVNGVAYTWQHCYIYQSATFTSCDAPFGPPAVTEPWHLNDYGVIAGTYVDNSATTYGYTATTGP